MNVPLFERLPGNVRAKFPELFQVAPVLTVILPLKALVPDVAEIASVPDAPSPTVVFPLTVRLLLLVAEKVVPSPIVSPLVIERADPVVIVEVPARVTPVPPPTVRVPDAPVVSWDDPLKLTFPPILDNPDGVVAIALPAMVRFVFTVVNPVRVFVPEPDRVRLL